MIEQFLTVTAPAASYDLTTLTAAKAEFTIPNTDTTADTFISGAITQTSALIAVHCNRVFQVEGLSETFYVPRGAFPWRPPGDYTPLQLSRWPVVAVTSAVQTLSDGTTTTLVQDTDFKLDAAKGSLFRLDPDSQRLARCWEPQTLVVQYSAGYTKRIQGEAQTVPANPGPYTVSVAQASAFALDLGVVYASSGTPLVNVASAPAVGQYSVSAAGIYTFAAADAGVAMKISYRYAAIPDDVIEATLRLVTSRWWKRNRDPLLIQGNQPELGGERYWVDTRVQEGALPPEIEAMLGPYRVPLVG